jgi:hypothetical protein
MANNGFVSFLMGATGAGLFTWAVRPGAPAEFVDSRSVEEYLASGDFEETLEVYRSYVPNRLPRHPSSKDERVASTTVASHDAAVVR